MKTETE